ncbi:hypothetical protein HO133_003951 [Letharia lupina]|uniref:NB-ARC domain-containing protein n=1 Tax=Letharia lupina TaxID=560253 RepID=A0A8H6F9E4_9LECA|nr:uncharacterized protein HO133_003951 [Letharia lupina]KAF6219484.1 hypothetical protein HO133_003951 [Letharia lupina]
MDKRKHPFALLYAHNESVFHEIAKCTTAILFFGTPQRGIERSNFTDVVGSLTQILPKETTRIVSALQEGSDTIARLHSEFGQQISKYKVVSFYETRETKLPSSSSALIVEKHSAVLDVTWESQVAVNTDHQNMCKFASREDYTYQKLLKSITSIPETQAVMHKVTRKNTNGNQYYVVPFHPTEEYTGKAYLGAMLKEKCLPSGRTEDFNKIFVLLGVGGIGKTQACLKFAQDWRESFWGVFWINGSTEASIQQSFFDIARAFGLERDIGAVKRQLSNAAECWLLIIDNFDDPSIGLSKFLPAGNQGSILISSRNYQSKIHETVGSYKVRYMDIRDAVELFHRTAGRFVPSDDTAGLRDVLSRVEMLWLEKIVLMLCHPLTICLAGAYIRNSTSTMEEYYESYHRKQHRLHVIQERSNNYPDSTLLPAWEISFEHIERLGTEVSRDAIELFDFFSFISCDEVDAEELLKQAWNNFMMLEKPSRFPRYQLRVLYNPTSTEWQPSRLQEALKLLASFSLLQQDRNTKKVSMHPPFRDYVTRRRNEEDSSKLSFITASTLASATSANFEELDYGFQEELLSQISFLLRRHNNDFASDISFGKWPEALSSFSMAFRNGGQRERALEFELTAMELRSRLLGSEHPDTLRSMNRVGRCLRELQRPQEAVALDTQVLESRKKLFSYEHPEIWESLECLATSYNMLGQLQDGVLLMEEVMAVKGLIFEEAHIERLTTMTHVASCYRGLGRYKEALNLEQRVFSRRRQTFGEGHPETLNSMRDLAVTYGELGQDHMAAELHKKALEVSLRVLGDRHPDSATSMHNLLVSYSKLGKHEEAAALAERVLDLRRGLLGNDHPDTLQAADTLAKAYDTTNRHRDALRLREQLLKLRARQLGTDHPATLRIMAGLAASNEKIGFYQNAIQLREELLLLSKQQLGPEHPDTLIVIADLATAYESTDRRPAAAELREFLLQTKDSTAGDHGTLNPIRNLDVGSASDTYSNSSDDETIGSKLSNVSKDPTISTQTSSGSDRVSVAERLAVAFEDDLNLLLSYEDSLLIMSRRRFVRSHMRLLKAYFKDVRITTSEHHQAIRYLCGVSQRRMIAEKICNRNSIDTTTQQAAKQTLGEPLQLSRFQLPGNPAGELTGLLNNELEEPTSLDDVSSDDSDGCDRDTSDSFDETNVTEVDRLVQLLLNHVSFSKYRDNLRSFIGRRYSPRTLRYALSLGNVNAVRGVIERHFEAVAKDEYDWLEELKSLGYGSYDIAELLLDDFNKTPWIFFHAPEPREVLGFQDLHRPNCVHQGVKEISSAPRLIMTDYENAEDVKRWIAEQCGIAGVVPKSRKLEDWTGDVTFAGDAQSVASITYFIAGSHFDMVSRVCGALQKFCGIVSYLRKKELCCNSFTLLHYAFGHDFPAIELSQVSFEHAFNLLVQTRLLLHNWESPGIVPKCLPELNRTADIIIKTVCDTRIHDREGELDFEKCFHTVSLAVQILSLGLYLYSQAHTGAVHPFFLVHPLLRIGLFGAQPPPLDSEKAHIYVSLSQLTCMAGVTGDLVAVFGSRRCSEAESAQRAYDLLASPEDLADTWDVRRLVTHGGRPDKHTINAVEIGDGLISSTDEFEKSTDHENPILRLHWSRIDEPVDLKKSFHLRSKALIGTTTVNAGCPVDEDQSWLLAQEQMETLGAEEDYWKVYSKQAGIQGGKYLVAAINVTWVRQPGTTLKHIHLGPDITLPFLQSDWGLQISCCTGAARRVSLCNLLADVAPILMDALVQKLPGWNSLQVRHNMAEALKGDHFRDWFDGLPRRLQGDAMHIIRYVLLTIQDTGIDRSNKNLVVAWPQKGNPLGCFKIPCRKTNSWALMLADSAHCATFAYVTPLCLETDECKCQKSESARWQNTTAVLNTAVSLFIDNRKVSAVSVKSWALRHEESYLIGKPGLILYGKVGTPTSLITVHNWARLYLSTSRIPKAFKRVKPERIREKQCTSTRSQQVMVLAKH